jgi:hypothetical protein
MSKGLRPSIFFTEINVLSIGITVTKLVVAASSVLVPDKVAISSDSLVAVLLVSVDLVTVPITIVIEILHVVTHSRPSAVITVGAVGTNVIDVAVTRVRVLVGTQLSGLL